MEAGTRIKDRYVLERPLGRGGMGEVWLARDAQLRRAVAVKWLHSDGGAERLLREARTLAGLSHPGIVQVHDVGVHEGRPYVVMERIEGTSLRERVGRMTQHEAVAAVREIADALAVAHDAGVVHRDVKPDNVMVREGGRLVLLDFGLASEDSLATPGESEAATVQRLTESGTIMGTPAYMPPEQACGRTVGPAADQFSLCVMAAELVSGKLPWLATSTAEMLVQILTEPPRLDGVDEPLRSVLARGLEKSPAERFGSMRELALALGGDVSESGAPATRLIPPSSPSKVPAPTRATSPPVSSSVATPPRRSAGAIGGGLATLLAIGALVVYAASGDPEPPLSPASAVPARLVWGESTVACPQLETRDATEAWLGAAVASDVCAHLWIALGGPPDHVLPPADLLELPVEPTDDGPLDPFSAVDARARQLAAARQADAWLDGVVVDDDGVLRIELSLRDREDRALAHVEVVGTPGMPGLGVVEALRASDALPAREDLTDAAASLLGARTVTSALWVRALANVFGAPSDPEGHVCRGLRAREDLTAAVASLVTPECRPRATADAVVASDLGAFGPAALASAEVLQARGHIADGAHTLAFGDAIRSVHAWPAGPGWGPLMVAARHRESSRSVCLSVSHWRPEWADAWTNLGNEMDAGSDLALEMTRRGYTLFRHASTATDLATLLLQRGRMSEVRTVAAHLLSAERDSLLGHFLLAAADAGEGRFRPANERLAELLEREDWRFGTFENQDLLFVDLVGHMRAITGSTELVDAFVHRFLLVDPVRVDAAGTTWRLRGSAILCGLASDELALRCAERVQALAQTPHFVPASPGSEDLLAAVLAWRRGDSDAAAPLVRQFVLGDAAWDVHLFGLVVSPILDDAGEPELAERLDAAAIRAGDLQFNGVSAVTVRAAFRAAARGDRARARELAARAVEALGVVDVDVARLDELRALAAAAP